jgi:CRP-like cAMP-binding protein
VEGIRARAVLRDQQRRAAVTRASQAPWPAGSFIADLPDAERAVLLAAGDPYHFGDEQVLLVQGDLGDFVYVLVSGLVKVVVATESGARTTLAVRSRGDLVGEFAPLDDKPRTATASAIGPVIALKVRGSAFLRVIGQSPAVQMSITRYLLFKMRSAAERRAADRVWEARERVAQVLFELGQRHAEHRPDGSLRLPITQGDLGDLAGVAVSTAERVLKDLRKQGVVATRYREITIKDMNYLAELRFSQESGRNPLQAGISGTAARYRH